MASRTIGGQRWPEGSTVNVYLASGWTDQTRAPAGPVVASAVVTDGNATFEGLEEDVRYVAWQEPLGISFLISSAPVLGTRPSKTDRERILALETNPAASSGGVLLWDEDAADYLPAEMRTDTSVPREFVGPVDPSTLDSVTGPVYGDRWTPTAEGV